MTLFHSFTIIIKAAIKIVHQVLSFTTFSPFLFFYYHLLTYYYTMAPNPAGSNVVVDYEDISYKHEIKKGIRAFPRNAANYVIELFPIFQWIHRYNLMVSEIEIRDDVNDRSCVANTTTNDVVACPRLDCWRYSGYRGGTAKYGIRQVS